MTEVIDSKYLPKELKKICEVSGGGDSLFESIYNAMKEGQENLRMIYREYKEYKGEYKV